MATQTDPVEQILTQFGKLRGEVYNQLLRAPVPSPVHEALADIDRSLGKVEDQLVATARKVSPLNNLPHFLTGPGAPSYEAQRLIKGGPEAWRRGIEERFGR